MSFSYDWALVGTCVAPIEALAASFSLVPVASVDVAAVSVIAAFPAFAPDAAEVEEAAFAVSDFETQNYRLSSFLL